MLMHIKWTLRGETEQSNNRLNYKQIKTMSDTSPNTIPFFPSKCTRNGRNKFLLKWSSCRYEYRSDCSSNCVINVFISVRCSVIFCEQERHCFTSEYERSVLWIFVFMLPVQESSYWLCSSVALFECRMKMRTLRNKSFETHNHWGPPFEAND